MSKKKLMPRIAPLQRVIAETITDPAEREALDNAHKREKRQREEDSKASQAGARSRTRPTAKRRG